jgi:hypothetical protein
MAEQTSVFTFEVKMKVQIIARDADEADDKLNREGGFIADRQKTLLGVTAVEQAGEAYPVETPAEEPVIESDDTP